MRVKDYLKEKGFGHLAARLIEGAIRDPELIRQHWHKYPQSFVIKCNHGCDFNILIRDKDEYSEYDIQHIVNKLKKWLELDFCKIYCEPQYKFIDRCIFVEEYLGDEFLACKFYCFNGEPKVLYISKDGPNGEKDLYLDYYDMEWNRLASSLETHDHFREKVERPKGFDSMIYLCRELSKDFPFVRVDLYDVNSKIYFSEFTFIPTGGNMKIKPDAVLEEWGGVNAPINPISFKRISRA